MAKSGTTSNRIVKFKAEYQETGAALSWDHIRSLLRLLDQLLAKHLQASIDGDILLKDIDVSINNVETKIDGKL
jgi:hypothetical protein